MEKLNNTNYLMVLRRSQISQNRIIIQ